jgi:predicted metal-dependent phosphoesterase TrpH
MKKIELHIHTKFSKDSFMDKYTLLMMCKIRKINCIAITDHNEICGAKEYEKFFKMFNIQVIVGEEIFTLDGEIIGLFLKEKIAPYQTVKQTIECVINQGGIVYVPHPYDEMRKKSVLKYEKIKEFRSKISFIEKHNGRNVDEHYSRIQNEICEEIGINKVVGSDAHCFFEVGRNYMIIDDYLTRNDIIKNLKKPICIKESRCIILAHYVTKVAKIFHYVKEGRIRELLRIVNRKLKKRK